jgi:hypothetical protein
VNAYGSRGVSCGDMTLRGSIPNCSGAAVGKSGGGASHRTRGDAKTVKMSANAMRAAGIRIRFHILETPGSLRKFRELRL